MRATVILSTIILAALELTVASGPAPAPRLLPMGPAWTQPMPLGAGMTVVAGDTRLFVLQADTLNAYAWDDGTTAWQQTINVTATPVLDQGRLFLVGEQRLDALSEVSGHVEWRLTVGAVSIAPTARAGWVFVANDAGLLSAIGAADGRVIWSQQLTAPLVGPLAVDGELVVGAFQDGSVRGWRVLDGVLQWTHLLGTRPDQVLAAHGQVYLTDSRRRLVSLRQRDGKLEWAYRVDIPTVGGIAVDAEHIYLATIDNSVRIYDTNGHQRGHLPVAYRIVEGLVADGDRVFVPQSTGEIRIFLSDGTRAGRLAPPREGAVGSSMTHVGTGSDFRLAMTLSEDSTLAVATYVRASLPVRASTSPRGPAVPLVPPSPPGHLPEPRTIGSRLP